MQPSIDAEALRLLFEQQANSSSARVVAFVGSLVLAGTILELVRRRRLREEFTPLWMTAAIAILVLGSYYPSLVAVTRLLGAWTPSSTVFFLGLVFLTGISLSYAVRLSKLSTQMKVLAQEVALLKSAAAAGSDGA
ncbi:MAG TPA: DUF2304 domain-containing protein [Candidatus Binatia bacterium]|nr:DUF2304 domain-containing protein [Candidatus Binatia bacterium]